PTYRRPQPLSITATPDIHHTQAPTAHTKHGLAAARSLTSLGHVEQRLGRIDQAAKHIGTAVTTFRQAGDREGEGFALYNLGRVEARRGDLDSATAYHRAALGAFREVGSQAGEAWALDGIGGVELRSGRIENAAVHFQAALALFRELGYQDGMPWALNRLGETALAGNRPAEALAVHVAALDSGDRGQQARAHKGLGLAHRALGDPDLAREHLTAALATYEEFGLPEADEVRIHLADLAAHSEAASEIG
ncbi:tetratricopeptide repeat protein, partial [Actinoplanes sp. NPDC026670]|uniref:tetratricopeptide repeat protein n=1 Tax=Actinoplanes sp. NPDC026670 TaxID=3154700 RepID=UPI0033D32635